MQDHLRLRRMFPDTIHPSQEVVGVPKAQALVRAAAHPAAPHVRDKGAPALTPVFLSQLRQFPGGAVPAMEQDDPVLSRSRL